MFMYSGTLTPIKDDQGIYVYNLGEKGDALDLVQVFRTENPSYLAIDPQRGRLFAVCRAGGANRGANGRLVSCEIDRGSGKLSQLGETAVAPEPAYVSVDPTGRCALYASTFSGSVGAASIDADGRLGPASVIAHEGRSLIEQGFATKDIFGDGGLPPAPFTHSIRLSPDNRFAFAPDVGLNRIVIYRFDPGSASLTPNDQPWAEGAPLAGAALKNPTHWNSPRGAGPRHMDFHPNGRWAYVVNEQGSSVTFFEYEKGAGRLSLVEDVSSLPEGFEGANLASDIRVHPSGRCLYAANRGDDSIAIFAIDPGSGRLRLADVVSTGGKHPRGIAISPGGGRLFVGNLHSDTLAIFRIEPLTGSLSLEGEPRPVPSPACIAFFGN
jgi:6-phosphogluconolactonase